MDTQPLPNNSFQPPKHEDDDLAAASHSTADYARFMPPKKPPHRVLRIIGLVLLIILIAAALAGGAYWLIKHHKSTPKASTTTSTTKQTEQSTNVPTKTYTSSNFGLTFKYPQTWQVAEPDNGGVLTARSPATQLKDASGKTVTGQMVFTIRNQNQPLAEFNAGNALASRTSEKIAYTQPSSTQRGSTYLSFLRYASTKTNGIDGIYITGDFGYQTDQDIPKTDIAKIVPIIDVTFAKCASSTQCSGDGTPLTLSTNSWSDTTFANTVKSLLESLSIQ